MTEIFTQKMLDMEETYNNIPESEAFEIFASGDITADDVREMLGVDVAFQYAKYLHFRRI